MQIIAIDDEKIALEGIVARVKKIMPSADVKGFRNPLEALAFAEKNRVDIVLCDVEMRELNGIETAKRIKELYPRCNIIFTTGYSEFTGEAMALHASGYILKPITKDKLEEEFRDLRHDIKEDEEEKAPFTAVTFGSFSFYYKGELVRFTYSKTKELLAYLIDREGNPCSTANIMAALWGDEAGGKASYFKNIRSDLIMTFENLGYPQMIVKQRGVLGLEKSLIDCDYFRLLREEPQAVSAFHGEYMTDYEWSEYTLGYLLKYDQA
ncbi:MAG: response regulator [Lachnospiraceae bacterium]|nr:response regulator [Lachnospiraceae bacterium]